MANLLSNIVRKQQQEISVILRLASVERDSKTTLTKALSSGLIKAVIGPRRSGKSSLVLQCLGGSNAAYLNFEDEALTFGFTAEEVLDAFEEVYPGHEYIFFDEIQLFPDWQKLLNRLHRTGKNIVITGSNSKLLSGELASSLTGRHLVFELLPFSFHEYLLAKGSGDDVREDYVNYLKSGGFPTVVLHEDDTGEFLRALWDSVILKDIVGRYKLRRPVELRNLLYIILQQMSARVTSRSLERAVNRQLSNVTINKFIGYAEQAYLCCLLQTYSFKPRERVNSARKVYIFDNGFYTAHRSTPQADIGKLLENAVFIDLVRLGFEPNVDLFSYQTKSGYEVDFFILRNGKPYALCQVAFEASDIATFNRETRSLVAAGAELNIDKLYLLTADGVRRSDLIEDKLIETIPAWELGPTIEHSNSQ